MIALKGNRLVSKAGRAPDPKKKGLARVSQNKAYPSNKISPRRSPTYHERAQSYIKSAKSKGMTVKAEGQELIAYPRKKK